MFTAPNRKAGPVSQSHGHVPDGIDRSLNVIDKALWILAGIAYLALAGAVIRAIIAWAMSS